MVKHRLRRSRRHRVIAGVAGGIAEWSGLPVWLVRAIWVIALIPGGLPGLLPYMLCWIFIPSD